MKLEMRAEDNTLSLEGAPTRPEIGSRPLRNPALIRRILAVLPKVSIETLTLAFCCFLAVLLIVFFLLLIKPLVFLRADILMWEENDFIGNIIKLNIGSPLYTDPSDGNSLIYNPLSFLVTYAVAWVTGVTKSVAGLRFIQLGYVFLAALLATRCCQKLRRIAFPNFELRNAGLWLVLTFLAIFLAATSPDVNKFVYVLHVDALSLLVSVMAFWTAVRYVEKQSAVNLVMMALAPAVGFLTKQFLLSWIGVSLIVMLFLEPRKPKRWGIFLLLSTVFALVAYGLCIALWGDNFVFWTVEVMGGDRKAITFSADSNSMSLARSIDHLIRAWPAIFVGVVGGWLLIKLGDSRRIAPLVAGWIGLIASEAFSSGAGWSVLYHFGPGVVIGAVFLFAALPKTFDGAVLRIDSFRPFLSRLINASFLIAAVVAIFAAWQVLPTADHGSLRYIRGIADFADVERYVAEIEDEFKGIKTENVLLGVGSWVYLRDDVLQKDRAVALGDQPLAGIYENFDVTIGRLRSKTYEKILVQDVHSPYFIYDWTGWPRSSGFREALYENYTEVKMIDAPKGSPILPMQILNAGPVSVFIRRE